MFPALSQQKAAAICMPVIVATVLGGCAARSVESTPLIPGQQFPALSSSAVQTSGPKNLPIHVPYALPSAMLALTVSWAGPGKPLQIKLAEPKTFPDPTARYMLTALPSAWAKDDFTLVAEGGLLKSVNAVNEDKTAAVVSKVIELAAQAAKLTAGLRTNRPPSVQPFDLSLLIDPYDAQSIAKAKAELTQVGLVLSVGGPGGAALAPRDPNAEVCDHSLCYRVNSAVTVKVEDRKGWYGGPLKEFLVEVPDQSGTFGADIHRGACIKRTTKLEFTQGVLTSATLNKPSEVEACLSIPLDILKAVVEVPGALFK
ncbi:MAG: hypothetical protein AAF674_02785 [Pseudomonadota bacterium]